LRVERVRLKLRRHNTDTRTKWRRNEEENEMRKRGGEGKPPSPQFQKISKSCLFSFLQEPRTTLNDARTPTFVCSNQLGCWLRFCWLLLRISVKLTEKAQHRHTHKMKKKTKKKIGCGGKRRRKRTNDKPAPQFFQFQSSLSFKNPQRN
jgi:hypothetical protein